MFYINQAKDKSIQVKFRSLNMQIDISANYVSSDDNKYLNG